MSLASARGVQHGAGSFVRMERVREWLGGVGGGGVPLSTELKEFFLRAFAAGVFTVDDIPPKDVSLSKRWEEFWEAVAHDAEGVHDDQVVEGLEDAPPGALSMAGWKRFVLWLDVPSVTAKGVTQGASKEDEVTFEEPTEQCSSDMAAQGALAVSELAWFTLSTTLGRGVSRAETKGFQYATPPVSMMGARTNAKLKLEVTFPQVLEQARVDHERPSWPQRPDGGHAPGVMRVMDTRRLQLVLWTP